MTSTAFFVLAVLSTAGLVVIPTLYELLTRKGGKSS